MTSEPTRTVVVAPNWVGDNVMALPVLEALAASGRKLTLLAKPHLASLLVQVPAVDEVIERHESDSETVERLRQPVFDEAVILPNSFRSASLPWRAGIPRRWGYRGRPFSWSFRWPLLAPGVRRPRQNGRHQTEDFRELLAAMEVTAPASWIPRLELSPAAAEKGRALLARAQPAPGSRPLIGLFPGAEFGPSKRWPWKRFVALSRDLRRRWPESRQLIVAGPKEIWLAVRIYEETGKIHPVIGPDLDLGQLAAVLAQLDLLVTNDSGPMHLAAALGVPCVALFGPTDPERTGPTGDDHQVLYTDRWCSPCFRRRCPLLHHRCLKDLQAEAVGEACVENLEIPQS
jgi:heptosyltransferase-2